MQKPNICVYIYIYILICLYIYIHIDIEIEIDIDIDIYVIRFEELVVGNLYKVGVTGRFTMRIYYESARGLNKCRGSS